MKNNCDLLGFSENREKHLLMRLRELDELSFSLF